MLPTGLECFLQGRNTFDRVGIPLYRVGMLSTVLECFLEGWNAF
jgi:ABC-type glycerol-3-phosphate transport system permease component